jgi:hypothetical protein
MSYRLEDIDDHDLTYDRNSMKEVARYLNLKVELQLSHCRDLLQEAREELQNNEDGGQNAIPASHSLAPESRRVVESIQELERVVTGLIYKSAMGHGIED